MIFSLHPQMSQKRTLSEAVNSMSVSIASDTHSLDEDFNFFLPVRSLTFLSINSRERALSEVKGPSSRTTHSPEEGAVTHDYFLSVPYLLPYFCLSPWSFQAPPFLLVDDSKTCSFILVFLTRKVSKEILTRSWKENGEWFFYFCDLLGIFSLKHSVN